MALDPIKLEIDSENLNLNEEVCLFEIMAEMLFMQLHLTVREKQMRFPTLSLTNHSCTRRSFLSVETIRLHHRS